MGCESLEKIELKKAGVFHEFMKAIQGIITLEDLDRITADLNRFRNRQPFIISKDGCHNLASINRIVENNRLLSNEYDSLAQKVRVKLTKPVQAKEETKIQKSGNIYSELKEIKELLDSGAINQKEFEALKARILTP